MYPTAHELERMYFRYIRDHKYTGRPLAFPEFRVWVARVEKMKAAA